MPITTHDLTEAFNNLDGACWQCHGTGKLEDMIEDCDVCYGTGYQPTQIGIALLNFLRRQRKRIEREQV